MGYKELMNINKELREENARSRRYHEARISELTDVQFEPAIIESPDNKKLGLRGLNGLLALKKSPRGGERPAE